MPATDAKAIVAGDDNHLFFQIGHRLLITRKLTGNFPDYERVLPKDHQFVAKLEKAEIRSAIERVAQFADERSRAIRVQFTTGEVRVFSSSVETGESEESVASEYNGPGYRDRFQCPVSAGFPAGDFAGSGGVRVEGSEERRRNAAGRRRHRGSVSLCRHADENLKLFPNSKELWQTRSESRRGRRLRFTQYQGARRPGGGASAARHVHRFDRRDGTAPPGLRSRRQFGGRSAGRLCDRNQGDHSRRQFGHRDR